MGQGRCPVPPPLPLEESKQAKGESIALNLHKLFKQKICQKKKNHLKNHRWLQIKELPETQNRLSTPLKALMRNKFRNDKGLKIANLLNIKLMIICASF